MSTGRKPDWSLCVKDGEKWQTIGVAWETEKGNFFIKLDEGETLEGTAMLFPFREKPPSGGGGGWNRKATPSTSKPAPPSPSTESDYMERKRRERQTPPMPTTPPNQDDCRDPEGPDWL